MVPWPDKSAVRNSKSSGRHLSSSVLTNLVISLSQRPPPARSRSFLRPRRFPFQTVGFYIRYYSGPLSNYQICFGHDWRGPANWRWRAFRGSRHSPKAENVRVTRTEKTHLHCDIAEMIRNDRDLLNLCNRQSPPDEYNLLSAPQTWVHPRKSIKLLQTAIVSIKRRQNGSRYS